MRRVGAKMPRYLVKKCESSKSSVVSAMYCVLFVRQRFVKNVSTLSMVLL